MDQAQALVDCGITVDQIRVLTLSQAISMDLHNMFMSLSKLAEQKADVRFNSVLQRKTRPAHSPDESFKTVNRISQIKLLCHFGITAAEACEMFGCGIIDQELWDTYKDISADAKRSKIYDNANPDNACVLADVGLNYEKALTLFKAGLISESVLTAFGHLPTNATTSVFLPANATTSARANCAVGPSAVPTEPKVQVPTGDYWYDLTCEHYREYEFAGKTYRISDPVAGYFRRGATTHKILDSQDVVHCVPAPGHLGCVLRWSPRDPTVPVFVEVK